MDAALLLVDVQRDYFARAGLCPMPARLIGRLHRLLQDWRVRQLPVIHVRTRISADGSDRMPHWHRMDTWACVAGTWGYEAPRRLAAIPGEPVLHKHFFSAFGAAELERELARLSVDTLIIAGLYTHGCIRATVLDAYQRGLRVYVPEDAIGSNEPVHAELSREWLDGRAAQFLPSLTLLGLVDVELESKPNRRQRCERHGTTLWDPTFGPEDIAAACECAARAAISWSETDPAERAGILRRWADALQGESDALAALIAREIGKPVADGHDELRRTLAHIRFAAELCIDRNVTELASGIRVRWRPVGTIGLITPWNNPIAICAGKLAPALAFGNACVWKPAPQAPQCSARLLSALQDAGLPAGVVELVNGDAGVARRLVMDSRIDAVSLTGSNDTGRVVAALCAIHGKPLQAELGGNNAALILNDWNFDDSAMAVLAQGVFGFAGQRCTAIRRLIVQRGILERFTNAFAGAVRALRVGDPFDSATQVGPMISSIQRDRLQKRIDDAIAEGAHIVAQSPLPTHLVGDHWLAPTLLGGVDARSSIACEETFGPIAVILEVDDLVQAIAVANDVPQGLVGVLCSDDAAARAKFLEHIEAGIVKIGQGPLAISAAAPFCGWKASAVGPPEHGIWDRDFYARVQVIYDS